MAVVKKGEFSSGKNSSSKNIPDRSQDFVFILSGALSDPLPESDSDEVFEEALRVIKPGGKIVIGTVGSWVAEIDKAHNTMDRVLRGSAKWHEKIKLERVLETEKNETWQVMYNASPTALDTPEAESAGVAPNGPSPNTYLLPNELPPATLAVVDVEKLPRYLRIDRLQEDEKEFTDISKNGNLPEYARAIMEHPETVQWPVTFNSIIFCDLNSFYRGIYRYEDKELFKDEVRRRLFEGIRENNFRNDWQGSLGNLYTWAAWQRAGLDPNNGIGKRLADVYPCVKDVFTRGPGRAGYSNNDEFVAACGKYIKALKDDRELLNAALEVIAAYQDIATEDYWYRSNFESILSGMQDEYEAQYAPDSVLFDNNAIQELEKEGIITKERLNKLAQEWAKKYFYHALVNILPYRLKARFGEHNEISSRHVKEIAGGVFSNIISGFIQIPDGRVDEQWYFNQVYMILSAAKSQGITVADDIWKEFRNKVIEFNDAQQSLVSVSVENQPTPTLASSSAEPVDAATAENTGVAPNEPSPAEPLTGGANNSPVSVMSRLIGKAWAMIRELFAGAAAEINMRLFVRAVNEHHGAPVIIGEKIQDEKVGFIFSERATFGDNRDRDNAEGLGIILPELAAKGIKVAVLLNSDPQTRETQKSIIDKLNSEAGLTDKRVRYGTNAVEIGNEFNDYIAGPKPARFYYLKTETESDLRDRNVVESINIVVHKILKILGRLCGIISEGQEPDKLYEAARKFAQAA